MPLTLADPTENAEAESFCREFMHGGWPRYVFGCTERARSIAGVVALDGIIDDLALAPVFVGLPVIRSASIPPGARVVSSLIGRPQTVRRQLDQLGVRNIDYFAFSRLSGLSLPPIKFWDAFRADLSTHRSQYDWVHDRLVDAESREVMQRVVNFRLTCNLDFMAGMSEAQGRQYFEPFLGLRRDGEVFLDVGGFDGCTSQEFIRRFPGYESVHVFEPDGNNMQTVRERLKDARDVVLHPYGVADSDRVLRFARQGSTSRLSSTGEFEVHVRRLDDVLGNAPYTFLKMDIEGSEPAALRGARQGIVRHRPCLAVCVYHSADDLWAIPRQVLSYRDDYRLYLRHYTEGVDETVMFFVPGR